MAGAPAPAFFAVNVLIFTAVIADMVLKPF
jgi:hypothetical protein